MSGNLRKGGVQEILQSISWISDGSWLDPVSHFLAKQTKCSRFHKIDVAINHANDCKEQCNRQNRNEWPRKSGIVEDNLDAGTQNQERDLLSSTYKMSKRYLLCIKTNPMA